MIKHIVLFRFQNIEDKEVKLNQIKKELEELPDIISELKEIQVGINVNPAEKWDLSLEALVANLHDLDVYANHPAHQQIVKKRIAPIKEDRACVDFEI